MRLIVFFYDFGDRYASGWNAVLLDRTDPEQAHVFNSVDEAEAAVRSLREDEKTPEYFQIVDLDTLRVIKTNDTFGPLTFDDMD